MPNQASPPTVTPNGTATNATNATNATATTGTAANGTNATINESMNQTVGQLPPPLDALGQGLFPGRTGFAVQVAVTALILFAVFAVRYSEHKWVRSMASDSVKRIAASGAVAIVTALGILLLVDVWGLAPDLVNAFKDLEVNERAGRILISAILLGTAYILTNFIGRVIQVVAGSGDAISRHQREILFRLTQVFLYATVIFVIISLFTDNIGSLLVGAGFFGIIVGMAARQSLGAVLAGFVLMFSRPFEIGDWIVVGDKEGTVTDITIFNTRLQTFDGEYVILPNDEVSSDAIVNRTRKGRLRIEVEVGVDYDADPEHAADVALDAVKARDEVLDVPSPQVVLKEFASSSVLLGVRFWIDNPSARRMWRARTAVVAAVKEAFDEEGISIPFPQRSLSSRDEAGEVPLTEPTQNGEATTDGGDE